MFIGEKAMKSSVDRCRFQYYVLLLIWMWPLCSLWSSVDQPIKNQRITLPVLDTVPSIDGVIQKDEWQMTARFDGMTTATGPQKKKLEERRVHAYIGASSQDIYIAMSSELPDGAPLVSKVKKDILNLVMDDSFELWLSPQPGQKHRLELQSLHNRLGHKVYTTHTVGNGPKRTSWDGNYEIAQSESDGFWHVEIKIPLEKIEAGRPITEGEWGISICRNFKNPWAQVSAPGFFKGKDVRFNFVDRPLPVVQVYERSELHSRDIQHEVRVFNPTDKPQKVQVFHRLDLNTMPTLKKNELLTIPAGKTMSSVFNHKEDNSDGFELTSVVQWTSPIGEALLDSPLYQRKVDWGKPRKKRWDTTVEIKEVYDMIVCHYPYKRMLKVQVDLDSLPEGAKCESLQLELRPQWSEQVLMSRTFHDLPSQGLHQMKVDVPALSDGTYELFLTGKGEHLPEHAVMRSFVRKNYEWEKTPLGRSTTVYPPFEPIRYGDRVLSTVLKQHHINGLGLLDQVKAQGKALLADGMSFSIQQSGEVKTVKTGELKVLQVADHEAKMKAHFQAGALKVSLDTLWDVDGTVKVDMKLLPSDGQVIEALTLNIPLKNDEMSLIHAMSDGLRKGPITEKLKKGLGKIWDAKKLSPSEMPAGFCSYIFLGGPERGFCWFAENDKGWSWDRKTSNLAVYRKGEQLILRVHLINKPTVIAQEQALCFGMLAAPVKPRFKGWRASFTNQKLMGTSINWLAGPGQCGNVYPAGREPKYWRALKRINKEAIPKDEVERIVNSGKKYFEPTNDVKRWTHHANHHLGKSHLRGKDIVFYYNRATNSFDEEYDTFLNEWLLRDMAGHDFVRTRSEQKLVPTESYIDFALHWYKKSFEIGPNNGVYWDNWFIKPSYNTEMTDAYVDADGSIVPAAGIWGLRALAKRTFQMMNELGKEPITFPHMTSASILPMLSFATQQLDWEWKYSTGDVQYRFTREYLQLCSTGVLAGVLPRALHEHKEQAKDEWTQRTFAGVIMVHDMRSKGQGRVWETLVQPVSELFSHPQLETYTYWSDRPQPVKGHEDVPMIVHSVSGEKAMVVLCSYAEKDETVSLNFDLKALGFEGRVRVTNVESKKVLAELQPAQSNLDLDVAYHAVVGLCLEAVE